MSRTTLTPKPRGLLLIETTKDSSARYFPLSQTIGDEYVFLFAMSRTIGDSSSMYFPSSRTIKDEYVFHSIMSNRLSDRQLCRGVLHTPLNHSRKGYLIARQTIVGRMQYVTTLPKKDEVSSGRYFPLSLTMADKYVFHSSMSNRLSDRYQGRGAKAYAPCTFIVYPFAPCRAFGEAYAIRPYPAGRKIRFEGLVGGYVWDKGR